MILHPLESAAPNCGAPQPVWDVILHSQKQPARDWLLVAQSDHAQLAGEIAARIRLPGIPPLDDQVLRAIALHDHGWSAVDNFASPLTDAGGRPLSFFDVPPSDILRAWRGSIARAEEASPIAGILVSEHFCRIARDFAHAPKSAPEVAQALTTFLEREQDRQEQLRAAQSRTEHEIGALVDVLQFCDLLSLYVCCGARDSVEFPQRFGVDAIRLTRQGDCCHLEPQMIANGASLAIEGRGFPKSSTSLIPVLLV
ncbi:MAG TPA: DUF3891 family protein [Terriglobales bacterium]